MMKQDKQLRHSQQINPRNTFEKVRIRDAVQSTIANRGMLPAVTNTKRHDYSEFQFADFNKIYIMHRISQKTGADLCRRCQLTPHGVRTTNDRGESRLKVNEFGYFRIEEQVS